jgi:hypothetical protein
MIGEPVLSEVVFTGAKNARSFMCGALSEKGDAEHELAFATELIDCPGPMVFPAARSGPSASPGSRARSR